MPEAPMTKKIGAKLYTLLAALLFAAWLLPLSGCGQQSSGGGSTFPPINDTSGGIVGAIEVTLSVNVTTASVSDNAGAGVLLDAYVTVGGRAKTDLIITGSNANFGFIINNTTSVISGVTNVGDGHYTAKLTSTLAGKVFVSAKAGSVETGAVSVSFTPLAIDGMTFTASKSQIAPDGADSSVISITIKDKYGNPVDGNISLSSNIGTISPTTLSIVGGSATASFSSTVEGRADITINTVPASAITDTVSILVIEPLSGQPDHIVATVDPAEITVKGSGGATVAMINLEIYDFQNNLVTDTDLVNNLEAKIILGPRGDENIQGKIINQTYSLTSSGGRAQFQLSSGTVPGTVTIQVAVIQDKDGTPLRLDLNSDGDYTDAGEYDNAIYQTVPKIYIRSGPPFSLVLNQANYVDDLNNGRLRQQYFAMVTDRWGNDIADGTGVYYGQIVNILIPRDPNDKQYTTRVKGTVIEGGAKMTYANIGNLLKVNDTVVITDLNYNYRGGYVISEIVDANTVAFYSPIPIAKDGYATLALEFFAGNNDKGGVFQGNLGGSFSATENGVAVAENEYPGEYNNCSRDSDGEPIMSAHIFEHVIVWAETEGKEIGDASLFRFSGVAPINIIIDGPTKLPAGSSAMYSVWVTDSAMPTHYNVSFATIAASAGLGELLMINGTDENMYLFTDVFASGTGPSYYPDLVTRSWWGASCGGTASFVFHKTASGDAEISVWSLGYKSKITVKDP
ncbi:hypothetical protein FDZ71_02370 [bacterium]|nr:MAG: hypothetical protein FDZ71_02370 [bacterium]